MAYQVLARKWRPKTFSMLKGQEHVTRALSNALKSGRLHHAYLFTGTRGVGKTTIARILAKSLNCEQGITPTPCEVCPACVAIDAGKFVDLIEVDAASRTRVEDTRELLENVQYAPLQGRFKIYLIDEVHMLSGHSFNAFLKTLEEPPAHVIFILATTDPERIPVTVLSRCLRFILRPLSVQDISLQLAAILQSENIAYENEALQTIAVLAQGSMRDALSLLEQAIAYGQDNVKAQEVEDMLGISYQRRLPQLLEAVGALNIQDALKVIEKMANEGADFEKMNASLLQVLHAVAIAQAIPATDYSDLISFSMIPAEALKLKDKLSPEEVQLLYQIGLSGQQDLRFAPDLRTGFEMILLRMILFRPMSESALPKKSEEHSKPISHKGSSLKAEPSVVQEIPKEKEHIEKKETRAVPQTEMDWSYLITQLPLSGFSRVLIKHCVVSQWDGEKLSLILDESQKAIFNPQRESQIQEALSQHFQRPIKLSIQVGEIIGITPAKQGEISEKKRQDDAHQSVQQNETIRNILSTFDATVEKITVE